MLLLLLLSPFPKAMVWIQYTAGGELCLGWATGRSHCIEAASSCPAPALPTCWKLYLHHSCRSGGWKKQQELRCSSYLHGFTWGIEKSPPLLMRCQSHLPPLPWTAPSPGLGPGCSAHSLRNVAAL